MTTGHSRRVARAGALMGLFAALALGLLVPAGPQTAAAAPDGQPKYEKADAPKPPAGDFSLYAAANCQTCHNQDNPEAVPEYKATRGYEFVRLKENKVWGQHDLHRTALQNLLTAESPEVKDWKPNPNDPKEERPKANATAQRMQDNLRRAGSADKYKAKDYLVSNDTQCLACHASSNAPIAKDTHKSWKADFFARDEGVGCEMCHGHGSKYGEEHKKNFAPNPKNPAPPGATRVVHWREWDPVTKREWGLVNLRDPVEATARCASCHIGNLDEGRFVTHEMYAVGHPPLPPLDLMAYSREQPRHWGLPADMPYLRHVAEKSPEKARAVFSIRAGESHATRRFVESTVAALRSSAVFTGQLAATAGKDDGLDYAAFDCASCHHNLKYPSDRQDRGYVGKPGRPLFRPAAFALTRVVLDHAAGLKGGEGLKGAVTELNEIERKLADAFTQKTYGSGPDVEAASDALKKWCGQMIEKLSAVTYDADAARSLLAKVTAAAMQVPGDDPLKRPVADPEVAQLFSWAAETLVLELVKPTEKKDEKGVTRQIPPEELAVFRKALDKTVVTRLRPDAMFHYEVEGGVPGPNVQPVDERIGKRMEIFNSFQAAPFRKAFQDMKLTLPK